MPSQHADLTPERWAGFSLDQQILMIANEMNRVRKLNEPEDAQRLRNAYARILRLVDLTVAVHSKATLRRELLRWRDLIARFFLASRHEEFAYRMAFRSLLRFTPVASQQMKHLKLSEP